MVLRNPTIQQMAEEATPEKTYLFKIVGKGTMFFMTVTRC